VWTRRDICAGRMCGQHVDNVDRTWSRWARM